MSGCQSTDTVLRFDTNKNDFRLFPLDIKKPSVLMIDEETGVETEPTPTSEGLGE